MAVSLPYDVIKAIEDAVPQSEQAEKVIRAIEQSLCAIRKEAQDREALVKAQVEEAVKEGLKDELASKEDLARMTFSACSLWGTASSMAFMTL